MSEKLEKITIIVEPSPWVTTNEAPILICSFKQFAMIKSHLHQHFDLVQRLIDGKLYPMSQKQVVMKECEVWSV